MCVLMWFDDVLSIQNIEYIARHFLRMCMDSWNIKSIKWISKRIKWSSNHIDNIIENYLRRLDTENIQKNYMAGGRTQET